MPQKKHNFTRIEIQAGIMVLLAAAVLAGFIAVIKGYRPAVETAAYHTNFTKIIGLEEGAEVTYGGLAVGRVMAIHPNPADQTLIQVDFEVKPGTPINKESRATIEQISLTAPKHLEVSTGTEEAEPLPPGSAVEGRTLSGGFIELPDLDDVVSDVQTLLDDVIAFLGVEEAEEIEEKGGEKFARLVDIADDVRGALDEGTALVEGLRSTLDEQKPKIDKIVNKVIEIEDEAQKLVGDVNEMLAENREPLNSALMSVEDVMGQAQKIAGDVQGIIGNVADELETLMEALQGTLNNAEGLSANARDFLESNRPAIEDMLLDLRDTVRYLRTFTRTLSEQPQSIIRGRAPEGRQN